MLGVSPLQHFPIDLTAGKQLIGQVDLIAPTPTIEIEDVEMPPKFACYPLVDQIADKLCAMYEFHGEAGDPSTRYRDLADLLLIIRTSDFDAGLFGLALDHQRRHRMSLELPVAIGVPGPAWNASYPASARLVKGLPEELHQLAVALECLAVCMDPILAGRVTVGKWDHTAQRWSRSTDPFGGL
ncbi:nucleotidyl transferase AbiEii/AbiGii toxin family protein [Nocardia mangyaensis]|nr:nucleotidyl transferase AbiEii/AbiGii toxin family protein [Nocardia mangyaensis]